MRSNFINTEIGLYPRRLSSPGVFMYRFTNTVNQGLKTRKAWYCSGFTGNNCVHHLKSELRRITKDEQVF